MMIGSLSGIPYRTFAAALTPVAAGRARYDVRCHRAEFTARSSAMSPA